MSVPASRLAAITRLPAGTGWRLSLPLLAGSLVYLHSVLRSSQLLRDGDTYWHVAAGEWIYRHGRVPSADPFSHTMPGAAWTAHEWLSQLIIAAAHHAGGWALLVALTAFGFAASVALLSRALLRWLEPVHVLLFAVFAALLTASHVLARPHMLAMPLLVLWTIGLVRARDQGRAPTLWLVLLMTVWANMHGGFTLGLALAGALGLEAVLEARRRGGVAAAARSWGLFVAAATAASMATPHGAQGLLFTWQVLVQDSFALQRIGEWRSPDFHRLQPLELWLLGGMAVALHQGLRLPPVRLLLVLGLLHLALKHIRNIELLGLVAPLLLAAPLAAQWQQRRSDGPQFSAADRVFGRLAQPAGPAAAIASLALLAVVTAWSAHARPIELPAEVVPAKAIQAARQAGLSGPVLNTYDWGGYLIYSGIPAFIDGRSDMYRDQFIKEYVEALELATPDSLPRLLGKYGVRWTLLRQGTAAIAMLDQMPGWRRVHSDATAVVHARTAP